MASAKHIADVVAALGSFGVAEDRAAGIGHNSHLDPDPGQTPAIPPAPEPDPFLAEYERVRDRIHDLYGEARNWCDGAPITTQAQADEVAKLIRLIGEARDEAEAARVAEKRPLDAQVSAVQARYNLLIGKTGKVTGLAVLAIETCGKALAPFLAARAREQETARRIAREAADAAALEARRALAAAPATDLTARAAAEDLVQAASDLEWEAKAAERAKPLAGGGESGRAIGVKTVYHAQVLDISALHKWVATHRRPELEMFLVDLAERHVKTGDHVVDEEGRFGGELPGVRITMTTEARL